jgi:hypothetical protein
VTAGGIATGALVVLEMRRRGRTRARHGIRNIAGDIRARL